MKKRKDEDKPDGHTQPEAAGEDSKGAASCFAPDDELAEAATAAEEAAEEWWGLHGGGSTYDQLLRPVGPQAQKDKPATEAVGGGNASQTEPEGDACVLSVEVLGDGRRKTGPWRDLVERLVKVEYPDWAVAGPRTLGWVCSFINRRGGGPMDHHQW